MACQIAKLRFFISLAIEQEADETADNFGIKPLPNLETRFVAANTLLSLDKPLQMGLGQTDKVNRLEQELNENRERHFHATTRQQKFDCREKDAELREELATELEGAGFSPDAAGKIAHWNPYDQNAVADWFDAEYMFGIADGFDMVIGNPPYIQLQKNGGEQGKLYQDAGYQVFASRGDIYQLFYERGCRLLRPSQGLLAYITSNSWLKAEYGKALRRYFSERHTPLRLLEMGKDVFENAIVDTSVLLLREGSGNATCNAVDMDKLDAKDFPPDASRWGQTHPDGEKPWSILSHAEQSVMDKVKTKGMPLKDWDVSINYGIKTGLNTVFIIDYATREALIKKDPKSADIIKPVLRGRDIQRYQTKWADLWLILARFGSYKTLPKKFPAVYEYLMQYEKKLKARGQCRYSRSGINNLGADYVGQHHWLELDNNPKDEYLKMFTKEKLLWMDMSPMGRFAYSDSEMYCNDKGFIMAGKSLKYLCAILNSALITWLMKNDALTTGMGLMQWKKFAVERLPIPKISAVEQCPFICLVDRILTAKAADPAANTRDYEAEIDRLLYTLYGLTVEEVKTVKGWSS